MLPKISAKWKKKIAKLVVDESATEKLTLNTDHDSAYDRFGANKAWVGFSAKLCRFLYESYFRVESNGASKIPLKGPVIFTANHGGTIPLDGIMLYQDILKQTKGKRLARPIADFFVSKMPLISIAFSRVGVVPGARSNVDYLLSKGEALLIFPEGLPGISKTFNHRYQLQDWRPGHIELAQKHRAAILPVALEGPDDQMPLLHKFERIKILGAPYLPIPLTPVPLPVRYHIYYGDPIYPHKELDGSRGSFKNANELADHIKLTLQGMIDEGLAHRQGVFS